MPQLNANNLPASPVARAIEVIRATLERATGVQQRKLNQSVKLGVNAVLKDAIEQQNLETNAPYIRIAYATEAARMNGTGGILFHLVSISLYFVYYIGKPAASVLPVEFTELRDAHMRWNMEYLQDKRVKPYDAVGLTDADHNDDSGKRFWWWPDGEQNAVFEHDTPLKLLGIDVPIPPSSGFACSRCDFNIVVTNHATFNGESLSQFSA